MTTQQTEFVNKYLPTAVAVGNAFDMNPSVILAQAALEGGFGNSYAVTNRKNHFGITASGSPNKYWDGSKSQSSASGLWFRIYKTDYDSFADFCRLISSKYKDCASKSKDILGYAKCISQSTYISESNGDNREGYRISLSKYAVMFDPYVKEYQRKALVRKKITIISLSVSLLVVVAASILYMTQKSKK